MLEINRNPSRKELAWFGLAVGLFFAIVGTVVMLRTDSTAVSRYLWGVGGALVVVYYAVPPLRRPFFIAWSTVFYPLGWLLTHAILALIYFVLITPAGLLMRLFGRDPMQRRFDEGASSYWVEKGPAPEESRYFRMF